MRIRHLMQGLLRRGAGSAICESRNKKQQYSPEFYAEQSVGSLRSAEIIVDIVLKEVSVAKVIDVGCGVGTWAAEFMRRGCDVLGVDGSHVCQEDLHIPVIHFRPTDLAKIPYPDYGAFDLAVCLEVIEHLSETVEDDFLDFLTHSASNVLFGGALVGQSGVGHVNEQWQSYWVGKFRERGYFCQDIIRPVVWNVREVSPWYAQNTFLFRKNAPAEQISMPLDVVHPKVFMINHASSRTLFGSVDDILSSVKYPQATE